MRRSPSIGILLLISLLISGVGASHAAAQDRPRIGPPAIEAVAAITSSSDAVGDPSIFLDVATTVPLGNRFGVVVRPYAHRLAGGEWEAEMYQLQLRYQSRSRIPIRIDAGILTSPLGLGTLELRPDLSPAIKTPFYYYMPLPPFEPRYDGVQLMSGGYPLGIIASVSGAKWDARGGVTDSTPARARNVFADDRHEAMRQIVVGGGVSPIAGLRVGAGLARGAYRYGGGTLAAAQPDGNPASDVTVFNAEAEYAVGHTRFSGEWVRNRFESTLGPAVARGYFVQAVRTFGPRVFATARLVEASAPTYTGLSRQRRSMTTLELSAGYRLGRELTLRAGYYASRRYGAEARRHSAIASVVWARRWF